MKLSVPYLSRAASVFLTMTASGLAGADEANSNPALPAVIGPNEIWHMGSGLVLIIVAIMVVGWLYSRAQGVHSRHGEIIHVVATQPLGPKERVLLVEVGGKQLLLGMTASQIQTLHVLEQPLVSDGPPPLPSGFAKRLRTAIKGARK